MSDAGRRNSDDIRNYTSDLAILNDWRTRHEVEHADIWKRFGQIESDTRTFIQGMAELKTRISIIAGIAAILGGILGQILGVLFKHVL